ncbi:MAG: IS4 family transposase [Spirulina sp. SIO3F2]|nr:IS4 family transposase [Spirulina sp. SIO3F2]
MPEATGNGSEAQSIYRFWSNPQVSAKAIVNSQAEGTVARALECKTVLSIQDTTDLDYTSHRQTKGLGYFNQTKQQGIKVHNCFAVSGEGAPLGLLHQQCWVRPDPPRKKKSGPKKKSQKKKKKPIESKESYRWLSTLSAVEEKIAQKVQLVQVADREADIFELFAQPRQANSELLIRAKANRNVDHELGKLFATLKQAPVLGEFSVRIERTPKRPARNARVQVRAIQVTLEVPHNLAKLTHLSPVTLNALWVEEIEPPADGGQPMCWRLLTTLPIDSFAQAAQIVLWYSYRWLIERFHFTLKSGCKIEDLQLKHRDRLLKALATYSLVAWRLMSMTYQARLTPDASCELLLEPAEWRLLRRKFVPKSRSKKPPTLQQAMIWIAQLGGFLARKGDGEPGVKTLWRGYTKLHHLLEGAQLAPNR